MKERLSMSSFLKSQTKPSEIAEGKLQILPPIFSCPHCEKEIAEPKHGVPCTCPVCGLHILRHGNLLEVVMV